MCKWELLGVWSVKYFNIKSGKIVLLQRGTKVS